MHMQHFVAHGYRTICTVRAAKYNYYNIIMNSNSYDRGAKHLSP